MAKITAPKASEYIRNLTTLEDHTDALCKMAVYAGAKVAADAINAAIDNITVHNLPPGKTYYYLKEEDQKAGVMLDGVTKAQAEGLKKGLGIAVMEYKGKAWNTIVGFDGYNDVKTETYPNGQPNALIARSVESGSTIRNATPFIAPAVESIMKDAENAMQITVENKIAALMKE